MLDDHEGVQTRLNEVPMQSFLLCRSVTKTGAEFLDGSRGNFRGDDFRLATAQAIHRNLVRIPSRLFLDNEPHAGVAQYLRGPQAIGVVDSAGMISAKGLDDSVRLRWCNDLGLIIENISGKEGL
jgi:CRISPR-associated endonuclease/helicase Cas3